MENLWKQFNEIIIEYDKTTEYKRKQYEFLKDQDNAQFAEMIEYPQISTQLQNTIDTIKNDTESLLEKRKFSISELRLQMKLMKSKTLSIKQNFRSDQISESAQLKRLSVVCNNSLKVNS